MKLSKHQVGAALIAASFALLGCGQAVEDEAPVPGDDEFASFGGVGAKSDGRFSDCQMTEALKLVNESTSDADALKAMGVNSRAANSIWKHRQGADGQIGTGDDNLFDDFLQLDDVSWVGPTTLEQLVAAIETRCIATIDRPYIDRNTFAGSTGGGWARDNVELEAATTVHGIEAPLLNAILSDTDSRGRTIFSRLRRYDGMEGLTYDYEPDEVRWDDESMAVREALPYVALSIESGRYEPDEEEPDRDRELSVGTDIMDDIYYDTTEHLLLDNGMVARGRIRWDNDVDIRRLLIAAKFDGAIDEEGIKRAAKIDVRTDSPDRHVESLDTDVMSGTVAWNGSRAPVAPMEAVYRRLEELDVLPDVQGLPDVLLLNPKLHIRSERSRYHLNEASMAGLTKYYRNGLTRIESANNLIAEKIAAGELGAAVQTQAEQLQALGERILSGEEVESRVANTATPHPDEFATPTTAEEVEHLENVANAVYDAFHEYAVALDDIDEELAASNDLDFDDQYDMFVEWRIGVDRSLGRKRAARPFLEDYQELSQDTDSALAEFNAYGEQQLADGNEEFEDWETVTLEMWEEIEHHLLDDDLGDSHRMISTAGIMAKSIWFDHAREFYVPESRRSAFSNFLIDTIDFTKMVSHTEWESIPVGERGPAHTIDPAKVFHTMLVNEVQIELGFEEPFLERLEELKSQLDSGQDAETERALEGARFVFGKYRETLTTIAAVKGEDILDRLEDEGAPSTIEWAPSEFGKGETGLRILGDRD